MKLVHNIKMPLEADENDIFEKVKKDYSLPDDTECRIYRESIDCRRKKISKVYTVAIDTDIQNSDFSEIKPYIFNPCGKINTKIKPVIVGMGPAGLFCAETLSNFGIKPIIIDRGNSVEERIKDVEIFWNGGELNEESNVQFGEGGAGTFSDGKLTCRKNDPRSRFVLETFVKYGADKKIMTSALPHIGTDILRKLTVKMRNSLKEKGVSFLYKTKLTDVIIKNGKVSGIKTNNGEIQCDALVLAIGNGSFDTFSMLMTKNLDIEAKPISIGIRQEHLQRDIDRAVYGDNAGNPKLPPASYSFYHHLTKDICVYSFCMCPGGKVVNSSSVKERIVTNGMSYYARDSKNANSALLVSISPKSIEEAMLLQKTTEENAFRQNNGIFPISTDVTKAELVKTKVKPTILPESAACDFSEIFPRNTVSALKTGTEIFHKQIFGNIRFESPIYTAPETRTSSPLRIKRDKASLKAIFTDNLYPCGEGAGYAGGIMSSAIDGIKVAEAIITNSKGDLPL